MVLTFDSAGTALFAGFRAQVFHALGQFGPPSETSENQIEDAEVFELNNGNTVVGIIRARKNGLLWEFVEVEFSDGDINGSV